MLTDSSLHHYTLDHLAAVCAAYHSFLKPYLDEEVYKKYREICNEKWEAYQSIYVLNGLFDS